jgi:hypothetical protein
VPNRIVPEDFFHGQQTQRRDAIAGAELPGKPEAFPETPAQLPGKPEAFPETPAQLPGKPEAFPETPAQLP